MNRSSKFYYGIKPQRCPVCSQTSNLLRCGACNVVSYCSAQHQASDRPSHKSACNAVKESQQNLKTEEASLRAMPADLGLPENVFTNGVGRFWGIFDTRDYMRARFTAADALVKANTFVSVQKALEHFMDMLRLCQGDNMGVRDIVPALMMRLGQEQECYDFLKWWATHDPDGRYDWGDMSLPYLNIRNADPFEPLDPFQSRSLGLSQLSILTLLKLSLYLDLEYLETKQDEGEFSLGDGYLASNDSNDEDGLHRPVGKLVKAWMQRPENMRNISEMRARLKTQYIALVDMVHKANSHFWEALVDEGTPAIPERYSYGSQEEADLAVHQCKAAWDESWDALVMIEADTAKYVGKYTGPGANPTRPNYGGLSGQSSASSSSAGPQRLPIKRGSGKMFPTVFKPSPPTATPPDLFAPFSSDDAVRFVHRNNPKTILIYTDGACLDNGRSNPRAGWAVVYGIANGVSGRLEQKGPLGEEHPQTSNRAELRAIIAALRLRDWRSDGVNTIIIATDSSYSVDGATAWARSWFRRGWKTQTGEDVKNKDLWEALLGEVERCHEQGLAIQFWRLPRELNSEADIAAKAAANTEPIEEFRDVTIGAFSSGLTATASIQNLSDNGRVVALSLEYDWLFDDVFKHLITSITRKRTMERAKTVDEAIRLLSGPGGIPSIILVADAAITRQKKVLEKVADCLRAGSTAVLCGCFSNMANEGEFNRLFARLGVPWIRGSYYRETLSLRREAVGAELASRLPAAYSQKALFVKCGERSDMWYTEGPSSTEAAVAFTKVEAGKLGYIGDVNGEEESTTVVMAMCGLL